MSLGGLDNYGRSQLMWAFDANSDGGLGRAEAGKIFATKAAGALSEADGDAKFTQLDLSGDGKLQPTELASDMFSGETLRSLLLETGTGGIARLRNIDFKLIDAAKQKLFDEMDADGDKHLSSAELAGPASATEDAGKTADAVVAMVDQDGDGKLSFAEVRDGVFSSKSMDGILAQRSGHALSKGAPISMANWVIEGADSDADGGLSVAEYTALRGGAAPRMKGDYAAIDTDQDGLVSAAELAQTLSGGQILSIKSPRPAIAADFIHDQLDTDGDNALSQAELAAASPAGASAILGDLDTDQDGKLGRDETNAAIAGRADFFSRGLYKVGAGSPPSEGEVALARLMWGRLDQLMTTLTDTSRKTLATG